MVIKRGEIWWADLPDPIGSEPGYARPVLIIQSDEFNRSVIDTIIVAALTSNLKLARAPGNVEVSAKKTGLSKNSIINISQLLTLDKTFLTKKVRALDKESFVQVEDGLRLVLGLMY